MNARIHRNTNDPTSLAVFWMGIMQTLARPNSLPMNWLVCGLYFLTREYWKPHRECLYLSCCWAWGTRLKRCKPPDYTARFLDHSTYVMLHVRFACIIPRRAGHFVSTHTVCLIRQQESGSHRIPVIDAGCADRVYRHTKTCLYWRNLWRMFRLCIKLKVIHVSKCRVFYETLRMFPPVREFYISPLGVPNWLLLQVVAIPKESAEDTTLTASNIHGHKITIPISKGTDININVPGLHYNRLTCFYTPLTLFWRGYISARYWSDPESFQPSRFLKDWPRDAFLPFSAGALLTSTLHGMSWLG